MRVGWRMNEVSEWMKCFFTWPHWPIVLFRLQERNVEEWMFFWRMERFWGEIDLVFNADARLTGHISCSENGYETISYDWPLIIQSAMSKHFFCSNDPKWLIPWKIVRQQYALRFIIFCIPLIRVGCRNRGKKLSVTREGQRVCWSMLRGGKLTELMSSISAPLSFSSVGW